MCQKLEVNAKWGNRLAKIKVFTYFNFYYF